MFDALRHDARYALRHLRRSPGFAAAAVLTLALGVGANTAMFSMFNALVLRKLPIADPDGLIGVSSRNEQGQLRLTLISAVPELEKDGPFASLCGFNGGGVFAADVNGSPTQAVIALVTGRCFEVFGVAPLYGRAIAPQDAPYEQRGNPVAVIGHRFWTRMFGADPGAIGKTIRMEGIELTVIGVMPASFVGLQADSGTDIYAPNYTITPRRPDRPSGAMYLIGRLKAGRTLGAAAAELTARWPPLMSAIAPATLPDVERAEFARARAKVERLATGVNFYRDRYTRPVSIVMGLTTVLLLLACLNLGGLLLARLTSRSSEIGVRLALGASRLRIAQQMLIESLGLSIAGAVLAVPTSFALVRVVASFMPDPVVDRAMTFEPDLRVLSVAAAAAVCAAVLMSAVPIALAWRRGRQSLGWDRTIAGASNRWSRALLVAQVALSVGMLSGAGILSRSLYLLQNVDRGVNVDGVLSVRVMPLPSAYRNIDNALYFPALQQRIAAIPGVRSVGFARAFPRVTSIGPGQPITFSGEPAGNVRATLETASPDFFNTVGIPLLRGRRLEWSDHGKAQPVAVVSKSLAAQLAPSGDVLGRAVNFGVDRNHQNVVIVGVVGNASLGSPRQTEVPVFYRPTLQAGLFANYPSLVVATAGDPLAIASAVTTAIRAGGREYPHHIATLRAIFERSPSSERMGATLAGAMAVLALLIAFIGIYGLLAYTVSRRSREIGVRVALGATAGNVSRMVVREGLILTAIGIAIGLPLAIASARSLETLMFGVTAADPAVLVSTALLLVLLGATAGLIPGRRASRVDPLVALRED